MIIKPMPHQEKFLQGSSYIRLFSGSAGSGKSWTLILDIAGKISDGNTRALLLRKTYSEIFQGGGLWERALEIFTPMGGIGYKHAENPHFKFPSGAYVYFGHLQQDDSIYKYLGSEYSIIAFDELNTMREKDFRYLMSRNRGSTNYSPYIIASCNPAPGTWLEEYVKPYIDDTHPYKANDGDVRWYVYRDDMIHWIKSKQDLLPNEAPLSISVYFSKTSDNTILLEKNPSYISSLCNLSAAERGILLEGSWKVVVDKYFDKFSPYIYKDGKAIDWHVSKYTPLYTTAYIGLDYGTNPFVCLLLSRGDNGEIYVLHEYSGKIDSASEQAQKVIEILDVYGLPYNTPIYAGADIYMQRSTPEGRMSSIVSYYNDAGLTNIIKAGGQRAALSMRAQAVHYYLSHTYTDIIGCERPLITINKDCVNLIKSLSQLEPCPTNPTIPDTYRQHTLSHVYDALGHVLCMIPRPKHCITSDDYEVRSIDGLKRLYTSNNYSNQYNFANICGMEKYTVREIKVS